MPRISKDGYICKKPNNVRQRILAKLAKTQVYGVKAQTLSHYPSSSILKTTNDDNK